MSVPASLFVDVHATFVAAKRSLQFAKNSFFPPQTVVRVEHPRYKGLGIVVVDDRCPPEDLAVLLENGNTWFYSAVTCLPVADRKLWPKWAKSQIAKWNRRKRDTGTR
jgi:hypothetical protein